MSRTLNEAIFILIIVVLVMLWLSGCVSGRTTFMASKDGGVHLNSQNLGNITAEWRSADYDPLTGHSVTSEARVTTEKADTYGALKTAIGAVAGYAAGAGVLP